MKLRTIAAAALASTIIAGGAQIAQADEYNMYSPMSVHDWSGLYVGKFAAAAMIIDEYIYGYGGFGVALGYNWQNGSTVYGVEKYLGYGPGIDDGIGIFQATGRIGTTITDNTLLYGSLGIGLLFDSGDSDAFFAFGGGVEVAMNEQLAWRTHVQFTPDGDYLIAGIATGFTYNID